MTKKQYFHFSIGPVQEFVGKARRLRDYWTGSYLLSHLIEVGLQEIENQRGELVFPGYPKNKEARDTHPNFMVGAFPNRFLARVPLDFDPVVYTGKIRAAWLEIAGYIWENYVTKVAFLGRDSEGIWQRQVDGFWQMQWVLDDEENDALLDIRKNWRSHVPTVEPGDKCTLFGNLQELSGYIRSTGKKEREKQEEFWRAMRSNLSSLDLKENERLSAVALIKRLFPSAYNALQGSLLLPENFPSTTYMSGVSWKKEVMEKEEALAFDFVKKARGLKAKGSEAKAGIKVLEELAGRSEKLGEFIALDGNCFYSHTLLNDSLWAEGTREAREILEGKLKEIKKAIGFEADTYYALLSMDGDKIGAILRDYKDKKKEVSEAISVFSRNVPKIATDHSGRVVYAGGEDVFAIFPINTALGAALDLKNTYEELFEEVFGEKKIATISAAILFAHHNAPLNQLYFEIQSLLDKKAKSEYGRSSLAIGIWKTGGLDLSWAMPWEKFDVNGTGDHLLKLAGAIGETAGGIGISTSYIYNIRKNESLFSANSLLNDEEVLDLLTAEFIKSSTKEGKKHSPGEIRDHMQMLLELCSLYYRNEAGIIEKIPGFNFDGALLTKFLAGRRQW